MNILILKKYTLQISLLLISLFFMTTLLNANASFPTNEKVSGTEITVRKQQKKKKSKFKRFFKKLHKKAVKRYQKTKQFFKTLREENYYGTLAMWLFIASIVFLIIPLPSSLAAALTIICFVLSLLSALIGIYSDDDKRRANTITIISLVTLVAALYLYFNQYFSII